MFSGQIGGLLVGGNKYDDNNVMEVYILFDQKYLGKQAPEKSFDMCYLVLFSYFS